LTEQSQFGLRRFGARMWLGGAVVLWGIAQLCMGFAKTWQQLAGLRAVLGAFESALFPGAAYLLACWYPRKSMASRNTIFYMLSAFSSSCTTPLTYCFTLLHRRGGLSGWAWMFILCGVLTIVIGILALLFLVDVPAKATFLTEEERSFVRTRIERDRADSEDDPLTKEKLMRYLGDWQLWLYGVMFMSNNIAACESADPACSLTLTLQTPKRTFSRSFSSRWDSTTSEPCFSVSLCNCRG
jgi:MFS family permease